MTYFQTWTLHWHITNLKRRKSWEKKNLNLPLQLLFNGHLEFIWLICFKLYSLLKQKLKAWIFLATISRFDLIDFMFLVVVLLKLKLKLEFFLQRFQALIWLISCFYLCCQNKIQALLLKTKFQALIGLICFWLL